MQTAEDSITRTCDTALRACSTCSIVKHLTSEFFPPHRRRRSEFAAQCRSCHLLRYAAWREGRREILRAQSRALREKDIEKAREKGRAFQAEHRRRNPEKVRARVREALRRYRQKNKAENRPQRVRHNVSSSIATTLRGCLNGKKAGRKWPEILGYTVSTLIAHIERQFSGKMSWSNWGTVWHIDHIRPVSSFSIEGVDCPQFRDCWALSNLRPLLVKDNLKKAAHQTFLI